MSYRLLAPALDDLEAIDSWIVSHFGARAANRAQQKLFETFAVLTTQPHMGAERMDIAAPPIRFFASSPNWIIYEPGDPLLIHRVFPARMDLNRLDL